MSPPSLGFSAVKESNSSWSTASASSLESAFLPDPASGPNYRTSSLPVCSEWLFGIDVQKVGIAGAKTGEEFEAACISFSIILPVWVPGGALFLTNFRTSANIWLNERGNLRCEVIVGSKAKQKAVTEGKHLVQDRYTQSTAPSINSDGCCTGGRQLRETLFGQNLLSASDLSNTCG